MDVVDEREVVIIFDGFYFSLLHVPDFVFWKEIDLIKNDELLNDVESIVIWIIRIVF